MRPERANDVPCVLLQTRSHPQLSYSVAGVLKGYDQLLNVVLDETVEYTRGNGLMKLLMQVQAPNACILSGQDVPLQMICICTCIEHHSPECSHGLGVFSCYFYEFWHQ